jgi:transcriptional/translational regulatory protein YebC/TACO1
VASVRSTFSKNGGNLGTNGSLEFLFDKKGVFTIEREKIEMNLEEFELELIEGGASKIEKEDDYITIYTDFNDFGLMASKLEELEIEVKSSEVQRIPMNTVELPVEDAKKILNLVEKFEDDDDVQNVYHNMEITDNLMEEMEKEA